MKAINIDTSKEFAVMGDAVKYVIAQMPSGYRFHGYDLKTLVGRVCPKARKMYVDTILRSMRLYCHYNYNTVSSKKSLYEKL